MNWRERALLILTVVGFLVPITMITLFFGHHGFTIAGAFRHWGEAPLATLVALDLSISFVAFALWAAWEGKRLEMRSWWVPVPAAIFVGLCFALPLFLLLRERTLRRRAGISLQLSGRPASSDSVPVPRAEAASVGR
ncbi:MAG TPA: DUF2834 domain-containing protein [Solirubrobacterales bacterium]|nr:DUF2834 domain-containing protein [Solirubrobacterales bacterium]